MDSAHTLHIVSRQHSSDTSPLNSTSHPALINGSAIDDEISILEAHLISICCFIVIHCSVTAPELCGWCCDFVMGGIGIHLGWGRLLTHVLISIKIGPLYLVCSLLSVASTSRVGIMLTNGSILLIYRVIVCYTAHTASGLLMHWASLTGVDESLGGAGRVG